jgi:hypothetical protein
VISFYSKNGPISDQSATRSTSEPRPKKARKEKLENLLSLFTPHQEAVTVPFRYVRYIRNIYELTSFFDDFFSQCDSEEVNSTIRRTILKPNAVTN